MTMSTNGIHPIEELEELAKTARDLPHMLVKIPDGELTPEVRNVLINDLQAQLNDNHVAEKLGRAFMLGRLHRFLDVKLAATPPLATLDECNLYAGGYQYDMMGNNDNPLLDGIVEEERAGEAERVRQFNEKLAELDKLSERRAAGENTVELIEEMILCRLDMQALTMGNLMSRVRILEARLAEDFGDLLPGETVLDAIREHLGKQ
jgi:hypothetical protein